jgi:hypothetical protein
MAGTFNPEELAWTEHTRTRMLRSHTIAALFTRRKREEERGEEMQRAEPGAGAQPSRGMGEDKKSIVNQLGPQTHAHTH